jgi:hypothetical protein
VQAVPQVPQWLAEVFRFSSQPSAVSPLQSAVSAAHEARVQAPAWQVTFALGQGGQGLHEPQCSKSLDTSMQAPAQQASGAAHGAA